MDEQIEALEAEARRQDAIRARMYAIMHVPEEILLVPFMLYASFVVHHYVEETGETPQEAEDFLTCCIDASNLLNAQPTGPSALS